MKIITSSDTDRLTVTGMVVFDPWPFQDQQIRLRSARHIDVDGDASDVIRCPST